MQRVGTRDGGDVVHVLGVLDIVDVRAVSDGAHVGYIQGSPRRLIPPRERPELWALLEEIGDVVVKLGILPPAPVEPEPPSRRAARYVDGTT